MGKCKAFLLCLLLTTAVVGFSSIEYDVGIIGGIDIDISEAPYQVSIHKNGRLWCGGTIVTNNSIVTAGHCIREFQNENYLVRSGSSSHSHGGQLHRVKEIIRHPKHFEDRGLYIDYDVAIMKVSPAFKTSAKVASVGMVKNGEEITDGSMVTVTGWGQIWDNGPIPDNLQMLGIPTINQESCEKAYNTINLTVTPTMLCAGSLNGKGNACHGDSGGPLIYNGSLAGIVSWSWRCGELFPGVFTKVSALRTWIDANIK